MLPLRISLRGFLSYKEKQTIDFTGSSLWMLWGPNGVGKSAIFDAITFALYNTHRAVVGRNNNLQDLINHHSDTLEVVFDFVMNGELYRVRRTCVKGRGRTISATREAFLLQGNDLANPEHMLVRPIPGTDSETGFQKWVHTTIGLNYEAFTSSVLLLQGKSERLLEADPEKRYKTLAELIDLSAYQKLYLAADDRRKRTKGSADTLTRQIQNAPLITDEAIAESQRAVKVRGDALREAKQEVERLTSLLPQAEQWETGTSQLSTQQEKLRDTLTLLKRSQEIGDRFARFELLKRVLPGLTQILSQRERLEQKENEIPLLEDELSRKRRELSEAQTNKARIERRKKELTGILTDLNRQKSRAQERLLKLAPLVNSLQQMEQRRTDLERIKEGLTDFPPALTQHLAEQELSIKQLEEKVRVFPWLQAFSQARTNFATALKQRQEIDVELEKQEALYQQYHNQQINKQRELAEAEREEEELREQKTRASQSFREASQRLENFSKATLQQVCSLCGQSIDPQHAVREKKHLQDEIERAKAAFERLGKSHKEAAVKLRRLEDECRVLNKQIADITSEHDKQKVVRQNANVHIEQHLKQIRSAFTNMSTPFQQAISIIAPVHEQDWLTTSYPTLDDLEMLQKEVNNQEAPRQQLEELREQGRQLQELVRRRDIIEEQLERILAATDVEEAENARLEQQKIDTELETLTADINQQQLALEQTEFDIPVVETSCNELGKKLQQCTTQLEAARATYNALNETLQEAIRALPSDWQEHARLLKREELDNLIQERDELAPYEDLSQQLALADHDKKMHEQRIQELQKMLARLPQEAQRGQLAIQEDLTESQIRYDKAEQASNEALSHLNHLQQQQGYYRDLESQKKEAERQHYLYDRLADLLGRSGLQLHLLRRAEQVIIDLTNITLAGLSHHRLRLELRGESDNTAQAEKALDLVVYDCETGKRAMLVNQVSGSQRFRIAVSLALAIGRYTNREVRRIKSVIIDEGFGSLDKAGRDDMIQELTTLGQELERIILVSHQDEFAGAFPNRYSFELIDKASRVKLFSDN